MDDTLFLTLEVLPERSENSSKSENSTFCLSIKMTN